MEKKTVKDVRQVIADPISVQRHLRVKDEFAKRYESMSNKYKDYPASQRPKTESLYDLICSELAFIYSLRKVTVIKIIQDRFRYETVND